jgi:proteasome beta subunit
LLDKGFEIENRLHGTTTVGLVCTDGVVLGTDSRAMLGNYFIAHRNVRKIAKIDDHLGLTIAGGVADAQNIIDILRYNASIYKLENSKPLPVGSAARLTSNVFFSARLFPFIADVLVGGVDDSGPNLYDADLFGNLTSADFRSTGSGSPVAYGILETEYSKEMKVKDGLRVAVKAVNAAIKRNAGTGDGFDVISITKSGFNYYSIEEKLRILEEVAGRNHVG